MQKNNVRNLPLTDQLEYYVQALKGREIYFISEKRLLDALDHAVDQNGLRAVLEDRAAPNTAFLRAFAHLLKAYPEIATPEDIQGFHNAGQSSINIAIRQEKRMLPETETQVFDRKAFIAECRQSNPLGREDKLSFAEMLEQACRQKHTLPQLQDKIAQEWDITDIALLDHIQNRVSSAPGQEKPFTKHTWSHWRREKTKPDNESIAALCEAFGLRDVKQELQLWRVAYGKAMDLDALVTRTEETQDNGAMVRDLIDHSGISHNRMRDLLGHTQFSQWRRGGHVRKTENIEPFMNLVNPPSLYVGERPNIQKLAQNWHFADIMIEGERIVSPEARQKTSEAGLQRWSKVEEELQQRIAQKPFAKLLDDAFSQGKSWSQFIETVLDEWKVIPHRLGKEVTRRATENAPEGGHALTRAAIDRWTNTEKKHVPTYDSIATLTAAFSLSEDDAAKMWYIINGQRLSNDELSAAMRTPGKSEMATLLIEHGGISEKAYERMLDMGMKIWVWKQENLIQDVDKADKLITLATRAEEMHRQREGKPPLITPEIREEIMTRLTGRQQTVDKVIEKENLSQLNAQGLMTALCGRFGVKTLNQEELANVIGVGEQEAQLIRNGFKPMNPDQRKMLLEHLGGCSEEVARQLDSVFERLPERAGWIKARAGATKPRGVKPSAEE